jgi:hypothetical protein
MDYSAGMDIRLPSTSQWRGVVIQSFIHRPDGAIEAAFPGEGNAMSPDNVLTMLRSTAHLQDVTPEQALLDLIELLARTYESMDSYDWEVIATVGALLWGEKMENLDAEGGLEDFVRSLRKRNPGK